ncbi:SecC motif-containing protein [Streptomyces carminius]|uniref:SecC motif-containing protein n=1 Tax=Streptomyces carminius TaxID=2665496 RepID=A0A2M8MBS1_9ACTN|nr:SecC motif-containing protein [Streptomyces carminius]
MHTGDVPGVLHTLHDRLARLRTLRHSDVRRFSAQVRSVLVVASSSRGGSSMVTEILRASRALVHLQAEINPFLRLAGLGFADSGTGSDRLDASHATALTSAARELLDEELARDAGTAADLPDPEQFSLDVAWRLAVQWPELPLSPLAVADRVRHLLLRDTPSWDPAVVTMTVLRELHRQGVPVSPWYYDLPRELLRREGFGSPSPCAPGRLLVEEPPFVLARPWRRASPADLRDKTLVIKTPSNAYRLDFLRAFFPNARLRVLHLTRNPAAAVNGLYDGWLHNGFHAHRMTAPLAIADYVEQCPDNRWWWKFDLPPGWQHYTGAPLPRVCAFQWRSSHQAVLDDLDRTRTDSLTLHFEDLISGPDRRVTSFERLCDWLGIPLDGEFRHAVHHGIAPVVATARPRAGRWQDRADLIGRSLDTATLQVADRLGYADTGDWI